MKQRLATSGIYLITNRVNGKVYVGSAQQIYKRWWAHRNALRLGVHKNPHLMAAFKKYGSDALIFSVLIYCAPGDLDLYEVAAITGFNSTDPSTGYNIRAGGDGGGSRERRVSEATRAKMSAAHRGHTRNLGRKLSAEHKTAISEALKGRPKGPSRKPPEPHSDALRAKKAEAAKRRVSTEAGRHQVLDAARKSQASRARKKAV